LLLPTLSNSNAISAGLCAIYGDKGGSGHGHINEKEDLNFTPEILSEDNLSLPKCLYDIPYLFSGANFTERNHGCI